ncbi:trypsin-like serine protease [bacterium]|nr:trypsin-like serine protease [bacterium]
MFELQPHHLKFLRKSILVVLAGIGGTFTCTSASAQIELDTNIRPQIRGAPPASASQIERFGVVQVRTTAGSCTGTLLNQYWVLTAHHCVTTDGDIGGPLLPPASVTVSATWNGQTAMPTEIVDYFRRDGLDVALLYLGRGDLGNRDEKRLLIGHSITDTSVALMSSPR